MKPSKKLRSQSWFHDLSDPGMTALYLERYLNYGLTREELQSGRPIIGIAQTGSDLVPCNRHHQQLAIRVKEGVRDAGGIPVEFPIHPIQETGKRPTAALDRNLSYLSLVEVLYGYPLDGVVLTTGCDKTTPACIMGAATVNIPSIVLSGGPMLDGFYKGSCVGSGSIIWKARELLAKGEINQEEFFDMASGSAPSIGHCNTMGTALSMNSLAEALGMSLPKCGSIPAPYRERSQMAYKTGKRIVEMVFEDLKPSDILTRHAFENAIVVAAAIGASTNVPIHLIACAKHIGVPLSLEDWQKIGAEIPLLVNCQPAGTYLAESFHKAGGVSSTIHSLMLAGKIHKDALTVTGKSIEENNINCPSINEDVIAPFHKPFGIHSGFKILSGNLFETALLKTSVISEEFRKRYLEKPGEEDIFTVKAIVFEGPEDYHQRIDDPKLNIDQDCILVMRGCGPIGYPGSAEVMNMQPPAALIKKGITSLPTMGDGRQSGTSASPSILHISPEAAVGGNLGIIRTNDLIKIDLKRRRVDILIDEQELEKRKKEVNTTYPNSQTPWQEIYRAYVTQLQEGACLDCATKYQKIIETKGEPRHSH
ncbi:MAG: dihydroxy-acid dehydratase family protein [Chlamydiae bacterium]|nr:dihydroxy-acid dehydratase family protein [Chlamydiota bacterium]